VVAASFFTLGLASWQVLLCLLVGICIVQLCANLVAKPSQMAGVPYAVISRQAFGVFGANIPAVIRGLIAFAWYGIQTYLAANALMLVALKFWPSLCAHHRRVPWPVASGLDLLCHYVGVAGDGLLARHERHQALYRYRRPGGLCGDAGACGLDCIQDRF
jgi:cytosine/uracil/thiamine/allantoin permease